MSALEFPDDFYLRCIKLPGSNPGVGGMYAAAKDGVDNPIIAAPQSPEFVDSEKWRFGPPDNSGNRQILFVPSGPQANIVLPTYGWTNLSEAPGTDIVLTIDPSAYQIKQVGETDDGRPILTIRPTGHLVGMDYYVGVEDDILKIQGFDIRGSQEGRPGWIVY
ncbi:hypothetical protein FRC12_008021 [Ceratobasidium sp. 428]|nr:hypothetical protein FRC09_005605 [Ceratobasidium sp. 395]KAG8764564.1 hypothetical protein FRC12_008021 [Ceratobasidium sp. 428]